MPLRGENGALSRGAVLGAWAGNAASPIPHAFGRQVREAGPGPSPVERGDYSGECGAFSHGKVPCAWDDEMRPHPWPLSKGEGKMPLPGENGALSRGAVLGAWAYEERLEPHSPTPFLWSQSSRTTSDQSRAQLTPGSLARKRVHN